MNIGKPLLFNVDVYLSLVEMYIASDEIEKALLLLDNPPTYYKDFPTERMIKLREELHRQTWTPVQYRGIYKDQAIDEESLKACMDLLRFKEVAKIVDGINGQGAIPNIMELAPGPLFILKGLEKLGLNFTYEYLSIDGSVSTEAHDHNIFIAFEIIEHLNPIEIYQNYLKFGKKADVVMISTPLYCYGNGLFDEFRNRPLGHLRTYGPIGLHKTVAEMFSGYIWECKTDETIVLIGKK